MNEIRVWNNRNWLWPVEDYFCWRDNTHFHATMPHDIIDTIGNVSTVVHAGGNCGIYTSMYAALADEVITFEPELNNFKCLLHNVYEKNVTMHNAALGNTNDGVSMSVDPINAGASHVIGEGVIPQVRLDDYQYAPDLLHLDIEGHESYALLGALETIKEHRPAIVLEKGNGEEIIYDLGYKSVRKFGLDWLYL